MSDTPNPEIVIPEVPVDPAAQVPEDVQPVDNQNPAPVDTSVPVDLPTPAEVLAALEALPEAPAIQEAQIGAAEDPTPLFTDENGMIIREQANPWLEIPAADLIGTVNPGDRDGLAALVCRSLGLGDEGFYDERAQAAVKKVQSDNGLEPTGVVSGDTWAYILGEPDFGQERVIARLLLGLPPVGKDEEYHLAMDAFISNMNYESAQKTHIWLDLIRAGRQVAPATPGSNSPAPVEPVPAPVA